MKLGPMDPKAHYLFTPSDIENPAARRLVESYDIEELDPLVTALNSSNEEESEYRTLAQAIINYELSLHKKVVFGRRTIYQIPVENPQKHYERIARKLEFLLNLC